MDKKILITARSFGKDPRNFALFTDQGYEIAENPFYGHTLTEDELCQVLGDVDGCLLGLEEMTPKVYDAAPKLKVAQKFGIGTDNLNRMEAARRGIAVTNVPAATIQSVADLTFGLLLDISKRITFTNRQVMAGGWPMVFSNDMYGKTLGIIGFGRIGQAVAKRARGFDMQVLAYDFVPNREAAERLGVKLVGSVEEVVSACDYLTLHLPKTDSTVNIIDRKRIELMRDGSYLVNPSRGGMVDEEALYDALQSGKLAGAACDVLVEEPPVGRPKLFDCENFIVTSHCGGNSVEGAQIVSRTAAENIMAVLEGRPCEHIVNREELRAHGRDPFANK